MAIDVLKACDTQAATLYWGRAGTRTKETLADFYCALTAEEKEGFEAMAMDMRPDFKGSAAGRQLDALLSYC